MTMQRFLERAMEAMALPPKDRIFLSMSNPLTFQDTVVIDGMTYEIILTNNPNHTGGEWQYTLVLQAPDEPINHGENVLPFKSVGPDSKLPTQGHPDDAGYDLYVSASNLIPPGETWDIPTGVAVELPEGTFGMLVGRSSAIRKLHIQVNTGIIDEGYRGELFASVTNIGKGPIAIAQGDRIAQLLVLPNLNYHLTAAFVPMLNASERGVKGFGSTGK